MIKTIFKVLLKLGVFVVCLGPALYVLSLLVEPDVTQWPAYAIILICFLFVIVVKLLIKKLPFLVASLFRGHKLSELWARMGCPLN